MDITTGYLLIILLIFFNQIIIKILKIFKITIDVDNVLIKDIWLIFFITSPIQEEYFFRYCLKFTLIDIFLYFSIDISYNYLMILTSLIFGLVHLTNQYTLKYEGKKRLLLLNQVIMTILLGLICFSANNLLISISYHIFYNIINVVYIIYRLKSDNPKQNIKYSLLLKKSKSYESFFKPKVICIAKENKNYEKYLEVDNSLPKLLSRRIPVLIDKIKSD